MSDARKPSERIHQDAYKYYRNHEWELEPKRCEAPTRALVEFILRYLDEQAAKPFYFVTTPELAPEDAERGPDYGHVVRRKDEQAVEKEDNALPEV